MGKRVKKSKDQQQVTDYRYDAKRKNNPPAGLAAQGILRETPKIEYAYNPHLPPCLRFDERGEADRLPELLETATQRALSNKEVHILAKALKTHEPWLEWAGKREKKGFSVDPVALHIHERISAQAILKIAAREDTSELLPGLFANPELEYHKAVQFYQHDVDWSNRMILGDSLQVMTSLARREDLAGKVQMIYMDPPYGIRFGSNFQPEVNKRDVKDREVDLTRELDMVKAYRDTWSLGIHSYLTYLRDRLIVCRELLQDTGSIFVQISDENLHRVRSLLDEIFGEKNFISIISFATTSGFETNTLSRAGDYLIWFSKSRNIVKYNSLFIPKSLNLSGTTGYDFIENPNGSFVRLKNSDKADQQDNSGKVFSADNLQSQNAPSIDQVFNYQGRLFRPNQNNHWKPHYPEGLQRIANAERIAVGGNTLRYKRYLDDFAVFPVNNFWSEQLSEQNKNYVVQTSSKLLERCVLMTTAPGDLVLDPTCGSGTTALIAEQWGRRWITIDTSRVALAIARQRLLTAKYEYYELRDKNKGIEGGFNYKTVPHITLKSIAQNEALDPIFEKHQLILNGKLTELNAELTKVNDAVRAKLSTKLSLKETEDGKRSITDADRRRWLLPKESWKEWEVPFDTDHEWPEGLQGALKAYRLAWRAKMDEVNACIAANADQEELVDQPQIEKGIVRVSGPFTMEGVMPVEESLMEESPIGGAPEELDSFELSLENESSDQVNEAGQIDSANAEVYLEKMLRLLKHDGVRFPNNKVMKFDTLDLSGGEYFHAEGEWSGEDGALRQVAVSFGPEHGPITAYQVENALRQANRRGVDDLVFAG